MAETVDSEKLLGLLGLARRAGRLAVGLTAVEGLVASGKRPLLVVARDAAAGQRARVMRLAPVRGVLADVVGREELARALGRRELTVVAVSDAHFVRGIERLADPGGGRDAGGDSS